MKKITKHYWEKALPCYKQIKKVNGKKQYWILYNEKGMTKWGPVEIK